jgi:cytochrome c oxidase assembly protein subunit 15
MANVGIVVTGGAVRLSGSGLGCPTWPSCTAASYVPTRELGIHGAIEFSNRMMTVLLGVVALACLIVAIARRPRRRSVTALAALVFGGIPAQAVLGGVTVLTKLNPWVVGCHFLLSMAMIAAAYALWVRTGEPAAPAGVPPALRRLAWVITGVSVAVLAVGTVVTGSGPHAGDSQARRTGLDPGQVSQLHSDLVLLLLGLSVALWFALRAVATPTSAVRATAALVLVELAQGALGIVQYATHLPRLAVGLHLAGACLVWIATLAVLRSTAPPRSATAITGAPAEPVSVLPATLIRNQGA